METSNDFLKRGELLVHVPNDEYYNGMETNRIRADGITYIAKILKYYILSENGFSTVDALTSDGWMEIEYQTTSTGERTNLSTKQILPVKYLVKRFNKDEISKDRDINNFFYHISEDQDNIIASNYVNKDLQDNVLKRASNLGLGSGIYGLYPTYISENNNFNIFKINCYNPYILSDKQHGECLSNASIRTILFMDEVIKCTYYNVDKTYDVIHDFITNSKVDNLVNLWNMVFYRNRETYIDKDWLINILTVYAIDFFAEDFRFDYITNNPLFVLPINYILYNLGYDSLISSDANNNTIDRGCVLYSIDYNNVLYHTEEAKY